MSKPDASLPIDALRDEFESAAAPATILGSGSKWDPLVVTAPTGSGKSTQIPRWAAGPVVVVEPRRVACRSLAQRVADLEGSELGQAVGYQVRDELRASAQTRLLFVTPGIALRRFESLIQTTETFILDEFHERSLETDLLLALLKQRFSKRLVVMSATLDARRLTRYLDGRYLHGEGRVHPVEVRHLAQKALLPDLKGLEHRVVEAVRKSQELPGDLLVFLPGKGEIESCARALSSFQDLEILGLHGGLSLAEQSRIFRSTKRRKVILATNVAETSLTVPGVGVVIDSGLVRRTRYHRGRGFLTLAPIARDSVEQRTGRAGRTAAGVCWRLWSEAALLEERTPPEIHRESLLPLILASANCGVSVFDLDFFDPPKEHALKTANEELSLLGALDAEGNLTDRGEQLFGLPLDAPLGRLLIEAETKEEKTEESGNSAQAGILDDLIDLVAALSVGRPLPMSTRPFKEEVGEIQDPAFFCDAIAILQTLRDPQRSSPVLAEALRVRRRLRQLYKRADPAPDSTWIIDRRRLALTLLAADPRGAHLPRQRGRRTAWSNGGTEIELGNHSRARGLDTPEALLVLETRALGASGSGSKVIATQVMPVPLEWLVEAGLGRQQLGAPRIEEGHIVATVERVYARRTLEQTEEVPQGDLAVQALIELLSQGHLFASTLVTTRDRLREAALAWRWIGLNSGPWGLETVQELYPSGVPSFDVWIEARARNLGFESGSDLPLLSAEDFLAPELPHLLREEILRRFPSSFSLPGATYEIEYDLERRRAILVRVRGDRKEPPDTFHLPRLEGFSVHMEHKGILRTLRS